MELQVMGLSEISRRFGMNVTQGNIECAWRTEYKSMIGTVKKYTYGENKWVFNVWCLPSEDETRFETRDQAVQYGESLINRLVA